MWDIRLGLSLDVMKLNSIDAIVELRRTSPIFNISTIQGMFQQAYELLNNLTHWGREQMDAVSQTTFSNAFSWMKMFEFRLKFTVIFSKGPINNIPALVQIMAWRRPGDKP